MVDDADDFPLLVDLIQNVVRVHVGSATTSIFDFFVKFGDLPQNYTTKFCGMICGIICGIPQNNFVVYHKSSTTKICGIPQKFVVYHKNNLWYTNFVAANLGPITHHYSLLL